MFDETNRNNNMEPENTTPDENTTTGTSSENEAFFSAAPSLSEAEAVSETTKEQVSFTESYVNNPQNPVTDDVVCAENASDCNIQPEESPVKEHPCAPEIYYNADTYTPVVPAPVYAEPTPNSYCSGVAYTKTVDGAASNGYEWSKTPADKKAKTADKTKAVKESSGRGFRVFVIVILSVFALSIITMSGTVISHVLSLEKNLPATDKITDNFSANEPKVNTPAPSVSPDTQSDVDYENIILDPKNSGSFGFAAHDGEALSIPEVAAKCTPSSVGIISEVEVAYNYPFYFSPSTRVAQASGSGFIYSADGYIVTNHHVIEDATKITVVLYDGSEYEAELIGSDSLSDLAVLKITPKENVSLIPMELGDSDKVVVGEPVVAIGCPAGIEFIGTVTDGIVSAINRNVEITDNYGRVQKVMTLIQTNATINHGNSGGPLINTRGQVIGINTLKLAQDYEGIGFSIPINGAIEVINQLIEHGKVVERTDSGYVASKGIIGINGTDITEDESEYYEIPRGVLVVQIDRNSPAAKAGLRRGDIITHYNGIEVSSIEDINSAKGNAYAGESATVTVYRTDDDNNGKTFDITFTLMAQE